MQCPTPGTFTFVSKNNFLDCCLNRKLEVENNLHPGTSFFSEITRSARGGVVRKRIEHFISDDADIYDESDIQFDELSEASDEE